jgi:hypothetical protein
MSRPDAVVTPLAPPLGTRPPPGGGVEPVDPPWAKPGSLHRTVINCHQTGIPSMGYYRSHCTEQCSCPQVPPVTTNQYPPWANWFGETTLGMKHGRGTTCCPWYFWYHFCCCVQTQAISPFFWKNNMHILAVSCLYLGLAAASRMRSKEESGRCPWWD